MNDCGRRDSYKLMLHAVCFISYGRMASQEVETTTRELSQFSAGRSLRCFLLFTWAAVVVTRSTQDRPPEEMETS